MPDTANNQMPGFIYPDWPAPSHVKSVMTTREGGVSAHPYTTLNLGTHVGDLPEHVAHNRHLLTQKLALPKAPLWLNQVHGVDIADHSLSRDGCDADAVISRNAHEVCSIMTADCLPVLFCNRQGDVVAAAHAGWRSLKNGLLEKCVASMNCDEGEVLVWLGAAIGPSAFEVGEEVREAFLSVHSASEAAFVKNGTKEGKWLADIYTLARIHLTAAGVETQNIYGGGRCTFTEDSLFFSYRRENRTGRMASLIWLA